MTWLPVAFEFEAPDFVASPITARNLIDGYMRKIYHALPPFFPLFFTQEGKVDVHMY